MIWWIVPTVAIGAFLLGIYTERWRHREEAKYANRWPRGKKDKE